MELDELKVTWQALEQKIERQNQIHLALFRHEKTERVRKSLRMLATGQALQIGWGLLFILLAGFLWTTRPLALPVIIAGVIVHAYGIACVITAALVMTAIHRIGYAGPVVEVQEELTRVRRAYVISGLVAGWSWWYLWIPLVMVLAGLAHVNLYRNAPSFLWIGILIGTAGFGAMGWLYLWSRRSPDGHLRRIVDQVVLGTALRKTQIQLEEIRSFEIEGS